MKIGDILYCKKDLCHINDYFHENVKIYEKGKVYEVIKIINNLLIIKSKSGIENFLPIDSVSYYFYTKLEFRKIKLQNI